MPKKSVFLFPLVNNYLFFQLFFYFSGIFIFILFLTFFLSSLDDRKLIPLVENDITFLNNEIAKLKHRYNFDEVFEKDLSIHTPSGLELILVDQQTNIVSGMEQSNIRPLLSFLYQTEDNSVPMARSFDDLRINGPFLLGTEHRTYKAYFLYQIQAQKEWLNNLYDNPIQIIIFLIILVLPTIFILSWIITRPLKNLRITANAVARGSLIIDPKIESLGIKEFREVGRSLNYMIRSLQTSNNHQQQLLSDISHELKTPLARLQLATAILKKKNGETKETERIENEIQKMNSMVLDLLSLSRLELNQHISRKLFQAEDIWKNILEDTRFEIEQYGLKLFIEDQIKNKELYTLNGNVNLLSSALENIIRNAQKYAKSIIKVQISITQEQEQDLLFIVVDDDGEGVPDHELEHIFRPFYRVDEARARQTGGTGLGLTIVANAVQQHQGKVRAIKSELGGLRVEIRLPLWIE
ncbi:envelope stress sensor histidine kinase CpxA [Haemophilus parahaemolyticus]|uniref:histidine kinase n=2 Tax=Haemophilus parahaemolyticus TaxID=735 RepID=A0AAE6JPT3_HAEPH|nr:envelope stress sensor histidine kinase CpxA [Haemophilus parahaemolyticus]EIJ73230.1 putative sensor protein CpxA [Haemophilus parahaemolyticus HK385]OOR97614.1 two-component sensor histidine kinase [Haemophilus parahaemolyticus]QEN09996.1 envelope stress sensor histidine kinase CpxA [Haemophilus parahaemolyticus]QRP12984.1 envelope stress sensor histidine kinase CpxA [Haemophilus parahaemolyticus]STO66168.1 two-component sensor protein [Haemophilus parahaemolyticus HK385]